MKAGISCWEKVYLPPKTPFNSVTPHCQTFLVTLKIKWWLLCRPSAHVRMSGTHFFFFVCLLVLMKRLLLLEHHQCSPSGWATKGLLYELETQRVTAPKHGVCTEGYSFMRAHMEKLAVCGFGCDCAVSVNVSCVSIQQKSQCDGVSPQTY